MSGKIAFRMQLLPGRAEEYKRRHDAIWQEMVALLQGAGIRDYSIHLDDVSGMLFAVLWRADDHRMDALPANPVMQRWWAHMADLMQVNEDGSPVVVALPTVFHLP